MIRTANEAAKAMRTIQTLNGTTPQATGHSNVSKAEVANRKEALRAAVAEEAAAKRNLATGRELLEVTQRRRAAMERLRSATSASTARQELADAKMMVAQDERRARAAEQRAVAERKAAQAALQSANRANVNAQTNNVQELRAQLSAAREAMQGNLAYANSLESMRYSSMQLRNELALLSTACSGRLLPLSSLRPTRSGRLLTCSGRRRPTRTRRRLSRCATTTVRSVRRLPLVRGVVAGRHAWCSDEHSD